MRHELRCYCRTTPLLALYGLNEDGKLYIHLRVYKASRIFGEIVVTGGECKIRCRECLRWYTVTIRQPDIAVLTETPPPEMIEANSP